MTGNNNLSKHEFRRFCNLLNLEADTETRRQVFFLNDKKYSFSVTSEGNEPQCRQTYLDCAGFATLIKDTGEYYIADVPDIDSYPFTRTTRGGIDAHSVRLNLKDMIAFGRSDVIALNADKPTLDV